MITLIIWMGISILNMSYREPSEEDKEKKKNAFADFAKNINSVVEEDRETKQEILEQGIEEREKEDKDSIMSSRVITGKLSDMRVGAGLSAFVGTSGKIKSPKFKRTEFIRLLARELLLIGNEEMSDKGGVISLNKLSEYFAETRSNWELRDKDIRDGVEVLKKEKLIPDFKKISDDLQMIYFKPVELSKDTQKLLQVVHGIEVTREKLISMLGWSGERIETSIQLMKSNGIAVEDEESGVLYFPGLW